METELRWFYAGFSGYVSGEALGARIRVGVALNGSPRCGDSNPRLPVLLIRLHHPLQVPSSYLHRPDFNSNPRGI